MKRPFSFFERISVVVIVVLLALVVVKAADDKITSQKDKELINGCPLDMVFVSVPGGGFCLDKYETSASKGCPNSNPKNQSESTNNLDYKECYSKSEAGFIPWRFISQNQAAIACAKAGKRLPSNKEWQMASLGMSDQKSDWTADDCQVDGNWPIQPGLTGSGKNCQSPNGAYDLIGNVWEWVDATSIDGFIDGQPLPEEGYVLGFSDKGFPVMTDANKADENFSNDYFWLKKKGPKGIARGGYWGNKSEAGKFAMYAVISPELDSEGIGFRCAK